MLDASGCGLMKLLVMFHQRSPKNKLRSLLLTTQCGRKARGSVPDCQIQTSGTDSPRSPFRLKMAPSPSPPASGSRSLFLCSPSLVVSPTG